MNFWHTHPNLCKYLPLYRFYNLAYSHYIATTILPLKVLKACPKIRGRSLSALDFVLEKQSHGTQDHPRDDMVHPRRFVGQGAPAARTREAAGHGRQAARPLSHLPRRHPLRAAHGLPVEARARRVRLGLDAASSLPSVGAARSLQAHLALAPERIRRVARHPVALAGAR